MISPTAEANGIADLQTRPAPFWTIPVGHCRSADDGLHGPHLGNTQSFQIYYLICRR